MKTVDVSHYGEIRMTEPILDILLKRTQKGVAIVVTFCALGCFHIPALAQAPQSAKQQEEADIRQELQRIIKDEPEKAVQVQKALDALNQPESSASGRQARNRRERGARRIVNGFPSRSHPAVGALLAGSDPHNAQAWCTGTLVGCDKFLTAAHCVADNSSAEFCSSFSRRWAFSG